MICSKKVINLLALFFLSACAGRDATVMLTVTRDPVMVVQGDSVLALPLMMRTQDHRVEADLNRYYSAVLGENLEGVRFTTDGLLHERSRDAERYFEDGKINVSDYHNYNVKFILLHKILLRVEYYSEYSGDDGLNPSYSAEYQRYPGMYESPLEWKGRSFDDYIYIAESHFVLLDAKGSAVYEKRVENSYILEDYRYKDVNAETKRIYYMLTEINTEFFLSHFRERDETLIRTYLR